MGTKFHLISYIFNEKIVVIDIPTKRNALYDCYVCNYKHGVSCYEHGDSVCRGINSGSVIGRGNGSAFSSGGSSCSGDKLLRFLCTVFSEGHMILT